jgi:hypothetical protein
LGGNESPIRATQAPFTGADTEGENTDARELEAPVTTIKATCPSCGEVELTPDDIELRVCTHAPASYYVFGCPTCTKAIQKPADDRVIQLLISGGVRAIVWELPDEILEPHAGSQLTHDDLLDFHLLLEQPDWFESLFRVTQDS